MPNLDFDSGLVSYTAGAATFSFNPTDLAFTESLFDGFELLHKKHEYYRNEVEKIADNKEAFAFARKLDAEVREIIDAVFGDGVSAGVFGRMNVYALSGGLPIWANFVLAVMGEMDNAFSREQKATNPRLKKYMDKYKKK